MAETDIRDILFALREDTEKALRAAEEKYLGAVACGLWILKPDYLEDSKKAGKWLNEEDYEWTETDKKSRIDGSSIRKWREKGGKAFADSKYISYLSFHLELFLLVILYQVVRNGKELSNHLVEW